MSIIDGKYGGVILNMFRETCDFIKNHMLGVIFS